MAPPVLGLVGDEAGEPDRGGRVIGGQRVVAPARHVQQLVAETEQATHGDADVVDPAVAPVPERLVPLCRRSSSAARASRSVCVTPSGPSRSTVSALSASPPDNTSAFDRIACRSLGWAARHSSTSAGSAR
ncbi:hypothetical protein BJF90_06265 [Pseudonocardia sp. CNS-004]|nr:hypothetical protein BJF90_06265 [Pseudonocardia sp. CNS-004]